MTANTTIPRAATTADRRARVSAIDQGLRLVTTASPLRSPRQSDPSSFAGRSLIATPGSAGTILHLAPVGRHASNDSILASYPLLPRYVPSVDFTEAGGPPARRL